MTVDIGHMDARELDAYATGYLEAMGDQAAELQWLREEVARLDREVLEARDAEEAAYRQAFGAQIGRAASARAIRSADILRARAEHDHNDQQDT